MKYTLVLSGFILLGVTIFLFANCNRKSQKSDEGINNSKKSIEDKSNLYDNYVDLRTQALAVKPEQLGINNLRDKDIFGVIMDWDLGDGIMTLITYKTGDASIYLSTGGGVIGGGQHEKVRKASIQFVKMSDMYLNKSIKADSTLGPDKDCVRFYFLTTGGIFTAQEQMINFENQKSPWMNYFNEANKVISELRSISDK